MSETNKIKVIAAPGLNGVGFHPDIGFTVEEYQELKYGSGKAEISIEAFEWLSKYGHVRKDED